MRNYISLQKIILELLEQTNITSLEKEEHLFEKWSKKCDSLIGSKADYDLKYKKLSVSNFAADLPIDTAFVLNVLPGDQTNNYPDSQYEYGYMDTDYYELTTNIYDSFGTLIKVNVSEHVYYYLNQSYPKLQTLDYSIKDNKLTFTSDFQYTEVTVLYLGYKIDQNGNIMFVEENQDAIVSYLKYRILDRERFRLAYHGLANEAIMIECERQERDYKRKVRSARAEANSNKYSEMYISNLWNNPLAG